MALYKSRSSGKWDYEIYEDASAVITEDSNNLTTNVTMENNPQQDRLTGSCVYEKTQQAVHYALTDFAGSLLWGRFVQWDNVANVWTGPNVDPPTTMDNTAAFSHPAIGLSGATTGYIVYYQGSGGWVSLMRLTPIAGTPVITTTQTWQGVDMTTQTWPGITAASASPFPPRGVVSSAAGAELYCDSICVSPAPVFTNIWDVDGGTR